MLALALVRVWLELSVALGLCYDGHWQRTVLHSSRMRLCQMEHLVTVLGTRVFRDIAIGVATHTGWTLRWNACRSQWLSGVRRGSAADRLLGLRLRILPESWMLVLCVVREDKKAKCRTIKTKKQVRMKYRVQENTKEKSHWRWDFPHPSRPAMGPTQCSYSGYRVITGGKAARAWR